MWSGLRNPVDALIDLEARRFIAKERFRQLVESAACGWSSLDTLRKQAAEYRRDYQVDVWPLIEDAFERNRDRP